MALPRWGLVGAGGMARVIARTLARLSYPVSGIHSRTFERAQALAEEFGLGRTYRYYAEMLYSGEVDIVYISATNEAHFDLASVALEAGVAVLCEKPLTLFPARTEQLTALARARNVLLVEAMWTAFLPSFLKVRREIDSGTIGSVEFIRADFGFRMPFANRSRLFDPAQGGGCIYDLAPYPLLLTTAFLGPPQTSHTIARRAASGVESHVCAMLEYAGGKVAQLLLSFELPVCQKAIIYGSQGVIDMAEPFWRSECISLLQAIDDPPFTESPYLGSTQRELHRSQSDYAPQLREVVRCWQNGLIESPYFSHTDSIALAENVQLLRESLGLR
ncbi:Gfo/Idh/MocA family protein [Denitromonas iodatirespirans]|uniref:Gfo/Idh/MocA family oxidoreductase n=1 Tax=Denitromonas iodatirespirans TaxID=2795389 RepID=A0A944DIJ7_DENI1|nr:Gfo/Idh/MocA family oxidoreductase [Denitromonas iodatirespirans]MBT0959539.1 Gfo/Idh/MocA family oxidoreductase [Denitromonas iodatirespirans]